MLNFIIGKHAAEARKRRHSHCVSRPVACKWRWSKRSRITHVSSGSESLLKIVTYLRTKSFKGFECTHSCTLLFEVGVGLKCRALWLCVESWWISSTIKNDFFLMSPAVPSSAQLECLSRWTHQIFIKQHRTTNRRLHAIVSVQNAFQRAVKKVGYVSEDASSRLHVSPAITFDNLSLLMMQLYRLHQTERSLGQSH